MQPVFREDEEIVITSVIDTLDGLVMVGTAKNDNYRVLVLKMSKDGELEWRNTYGPDSENCEGQNITTTKDGFLICGCSEGFASEYGGHNWKAYLLKVDSSGDKRWEKSFRIMGNECVFSLLAGEGILLFGETREAAGNGHLFLLSLDSHGDEIWRRTYCDGEDVVAGGFVPYNQGYILVGSLMRNDVWHLNLLKVDTDGGEVWERLHKNTLVYDVCSREDGILLTGMRDDSIYLAKIDKKGDIIWDRTYDKGYGTTIDCYKDGMIIAGKTSAGKSSSPVLYKVSREGEVEWKRVFKKEGLIEKVKRLNDGYILIRHGFEPCEHTEIIRVHEDGS